MSKPVISIKDVWKIYKMGHVEVPALRGASLDIKKGELIFLLGQSGSGKSTALNMLGALDKPTRGKILLDGKDIALLSESRLAQIRGKKIGFIFQSFNLIQSLTAFENVTLPMLFQNMPEEMRTKKATELLCEVGLKERMHHLPSELSGGEQQRVAVARALANDPEVIIADEPTGNLDTKSSHRIMDLLLNLHKKKKKTMIIVTHNLELTKAGQKIYSITDGVIK